MAEFNKLSNLVGEDITIQEVLGYKFKLWSPSENRMLVSDTWEKGYKKLWQVVTDKGQLDLGSGKMGEILESVAHGGNANIIGVTYNVKSNGKKGMDIRYFLNPVRQAKPQATEDTVPFDY